MGGAESVHCVDVSQSAVEMARANARRNGLEGRMTFEAANVFDLLPTLSGHPYDLIILDPPAFTKSRQTVEHAVRGYKEINYRAMSLLPRGGYLATCSCSHFMTEDLFCKMLHSAAADAHVNLRQIEARQQSPDLSLIHILSMRRKEKSGTGRFLDRNFPILKKKCFLSVFIFSTI